MKRILLALILSSGLAAGCTTTATFAAPGPPPGTRVERRSPAPSAAYVWIDGRWALKRGHWVWTSGRWSQPPRGMHAWVQGHWTKKGHHWIWVEGRWR